MTESEGSRVQATEVARFVVAAVQSQAGARWNQGPRKAPFAVSEGADPSVALMASRRLFGMPEPAAHAVCAWHEGRRPACLLDHVPTARQVLRLQAAGQRCVSLVSDAAAAAHGDPRHVTGLAFAAHDLCHLEKFVDPAHHVGQVGFFAALDEALAHPDGSALQQGFDPAWEADRNYVLADMNGSAVFLFAALKMKLKMAVRRAVARDEGVSAPRGGPLGDRETKAYVGRRDELLRLLGLAAQDAEAGRAVSTRRSDPEAAARLLACFESRGRQVLARRNGHATPLQSGGESVLSGRPGFPDHPLGL